MSESEIGRIINRLQYRTINFSGAALLISWPPFVMDEKNGVGLAPSAIALAHRLASVGVQESRAEAHRRRRRRSLVSLANLKWRRLTPISERRVRFTIHNFSY